MQQSIDKVNSTNGGIQQFANSTINTEISQFNNQILHDIHPVKYANLSGYAATLYNNSPNNNNTSINKFIFLLKDDNIYQFVLNDSNQDYHGKTFDRMVNSTKFFD